MGDSRNPDEIGALWIKQGAKGEYMTGTVNGEAVVVFRNDRKSGKAPDWRVLKSKPRDGEPRRSEPRTAPERAPEPNDEIPW